jgi:hypothetical protein
MVWCFLMLTLYVKNKENLLIKFFSNISIVKPTLCIFLFGLLRIKGLYMFRALLAHLQEAQHKRHLVYGVHVSQLAAELQIW